MGTATARAEARENRAEQLEQLRRQIAAVPSRVGSSRRPPIAESPTISVSEGLLPVSDSLGDLLPAGLPKGAVGVLTGARSLALNIAAAVTAAGGYVAMVGQPGLGLLAATELGADLDRVVVVPDPGADPVEVAAVLTDGMDLVVLGLRGRAVPPSRARAVTARARQRGCTLLVTDGDWPGAAIRLDARVRGYELTGAAGFGRISRVRLSMRVLGRMKVG